jgi:hypothetical protein
MSKPSKAKRKRKAAQTRAVVTTLQAEDASLVGNAVNFPLDKSVEVDFHRLPSEHITGGRPIDSLLKRATLSFLTIFATTIISVLLTLLLSKKIAFLLSSHHRPSTLVYYAPLQSPPECQVYAVSVMPLYFGEPVKSVLVTLDFPGKINAFAYSADKDPNAKTLELRGNFHVGNDCHVDVPPAEIPTYMHINRTGQGLNQLEIETIQLDKEAAFLVLVSTEPTTSTDISVWARGVYSGWGQELPAGHRVVKTFGPGFASQPH